MAGSREWSSPLRVVEPLESSCSGRAPGASSPLGDLVETVHRRSIIHRAELRTTVKCSQTRAFRDGNCNGGACPCCPSANLMLSSQLSTVLCCIWPTELVGRALLVVKSFQSVVRFRNVQKWQL